MERSQFKVGPPKEIAYGIQFSIKRQDNEGMVRIYNGKKGIKIDLSQIPSVALKSDVSAILEGRSVSKAFDGDGEKIAYPNIGSDESGKGDYFGPLAIGAVLVDKKTEKALLAQGVRDSKALTDSTVMLLADEIKRAARWNVVTIMPDQYNDLYDRFKNLNLLLAWGHAKAVMPLAENHSCRLLIADQFGSEKFLNKEFAGLGISLHQCPRGERYTAVAAASVLARAAFLEGLNQLSAKLNCVLPKGVSSATVQAGKSLIASHGTDVLQASAKLHFRTTKNLTKVDN